MSASRPAAWSLARNSAGSIPSTKITIARQKRFGVSQATIYRDAAALVARGALQRVRGGVAFFPRTEAAPTAFGTFHDRASVNREAKERIAAFHQSVPESTDIDMGRAELALQRAKARLMATRTHFDD